MWYQRYGTRPLSDTWMSDAPPLSARAKCSWPAGEKLVGATRNVQPPPAASLVITRHQVPPLLTEVRSQNSMVKLVVPAKSKLSPKLTRALLFGYRPVVSLSPSAPPIDTVRTGLVV